MRLNLLILFLFPFLVFSQIDASTLCQKPDVEAQYFGGQDSIFAYIEKNLVYPEEAIEDGDEGKVAISFIVEKNGVLSNVTVINSVCPTIDKEAIRLVSEMTKWRPAISGDATCRSKVGITMEFSLDYEKARRKKARKTRRKRRKL